MRKKAVLWLVALAVLLLAGLLYAILQIRVPLQVKLRTATQRLSLLFNTNLPQDHRRIRPQIIEIQASQRSSWDVLFIGDSIVEGLRPDILTEESSLNAGVGGTGVRFLKEHLLRLLSIAKPSTVVVLTGINDALDLSWRNTDTFIDVWARLYEDVAVSIAQHGATPILVSILPPE